MTARSDAGGESAGAVPGAFVVTLSVVLRMCREMAESIMAHARADHPLEACGVAVGPAGSDTPTRLLPMANADRSPRTFRLASTAQLQLARDMDHRGEEIVIVYHSHPSSEAYPSATDVAFASEPQAHYVLVSTREPHRDEFRSYRIREGRICEEQVEFVTAVDGIEIPWSV